MSTAEDLPYSASENGSNNSRDPRLDLLKAEDLSAEERARIFTEIVQEHHRRLLHIGKAITGSPETAEDVAQEAFLTAWERFGDIEFSIRGWLDQTARRKAFDTIKKSRNYAAPAKSEADLQAVLAQGLESDGSGQSDPVLAYEDKESAQRTEELLSQITNNDQREILRLHLAGLKPKEIQEVLQVPRATVYTRLFRARQVAKILVEASL